jgi:pSer/pThr/pTyr-binding forkhead associated (FHA) protein
MSGRSLTYAEHVAFYQQQQLRRKRKQFELRGHPVEAPPTASPAASEPTRTATAENVTAAKTARPEPETRQFPIQPPVDHTIRIRLRVESGPSHGAEFDLPEGEYVIGRAPDANIQVADDTVSHHHAKIVVTSGRTTVQDLGSLNGSKLGDVTLRGTVIVTPGDHVVLGTTDLLVCRGD